MSDIVPAATGPAWRIVGSVEQFGLYPNGTYGQGKRITFQLENGTTGSVFIPDNAFTEANVKAMVSQAAGQLAGVLSLTHES